MKKFLSLVLALVMTMSLVTVSAGAKDFTDSSKINYSEAVDVLSEAKVIDGYADGAFNPSNTLTRGAAAKIICNLILGPTTASALVADAAPYKDVPTSNVFAGYIAYCQKTGIISGYADGTFRPAATLTGYAFMKMLLGALGYDATIEGYTGPNWSINVAKRALSIGLADDLVGDFNGVKAVTREEACLYGFNTLKATMVEYDSTTNITVGGASVVIAGSKAKDVETNSDKATIKGTRGEPGTVQFAEKYFDKLKKNNGAASDEFGRPATVWTLKSEKIGTYAETPDATYTKSVSLGDIYKDLGMTTKDEHAELYVNGADDAHKIDVSVSKGSDVKLKDESSKIGDGTIVEAYLDDDNNDVTIVAISVYAGEIQKVAKATSKKDAYVVVNKLSDAAISGFTTDGHNEFETTEFAEDDMVLFTYSESDHSIQTVAKMESVEGKLTAREIGKSLTVNDTAYKYAKNVYFDGFDEGTMNNKSSYTIYLDANGYVLAVKETEFAVSDYALVVDTTGTAGWNGNKAKLVLTDGSEKTVTTDKDYDGTIADGEIVTISVNKDGEYKLKAVSGDVELHTDSSFTVRKNKAAVTTAEGTKYADSKTVFVVKDGTNDYKVYTGIKNAPSITAASGNKVAYYCKDGDVLSIVFVQAAANAVTESSKDVVFVAGKSVSKLIVDVDDHEYYRYNAVVNGEITTVKVEDTATTAGLVPGANTNAIFNSISVKDGMITNSTQYAGDGVNTIKAESYAFGLKKLSGEYTVGIYTAANNHGLIRMTLAKDVNIYLVDTDGNITAGSVSSIVTDYNDAVLYTIDDGEITNLFIQEVDD